MSLVEAAAPAAAEAGITISLVKAADSVPEAGTALQLPEEAGSETPMLLVEVAVLAAKAGTVFPLPKTGMEAAAPAAA